MRPYPIICEIDSGKLYTLITRPHNSAQALSFSEPGIRTDTQELPHLDLFTPLRDAVPMVMSLVVFKLAMSLLMGNTFRYFSRTFYLGLVSVAELLPTSDYFLTRAVPGARSFTKTVLAFCVHPLASVSKAPMQQPRASMTDASDVRPWDGWAQSRSLKTVIDCHFKACDAADVATDRGI
ncbi:hypothetical protein K431DRAFT_350338 [Polychaeton citri CBS 116435]|uniref:Uncharacterized protein n=1 Tax=Polychaeton citri CBS 116435 TaxID=1314669 RepID=A0A9P4Q0V7_9PEZI|nr:hypothetical protein K431DRAFT_350338 [Polychaeton citri CBS 116435]